MFGAAPAITGAGRRRHVNAVPILAVGVAVVLALPLAWRVAQRRFDLFEPIAIFALAWGVMFVVRPLAIVIRDDTNYFNVDITSTLDRAVLLGLLGAVGFVVGYELILGRRLAGVLPGPPGIATARSVLPLAFVVSGLGIGALALILLPSGGLDAVDIFLSGRSFELDDIIQSSSIYLWYGSLLVIPAALVGIVIVVTSPRALTVAAALVLVGLALLRTLPTGNRIFLLVLVGGAVIFLFVHRERRLGWVGLAVVLVVALVISYSLMLFRYPYSRDSVSFRSLGSTPVRIFEPLYMGSDAEMAPALAGALLVIPEELPHRFGGALAMDFLVRPVPRQLWSGKPIPPTQEVTARVWPEAREAGRFDPAYTPLLLFFWDFGLAGAFLGMALIGVAARALKDWFDRHRRSTVAQLVFSAGICYLVVVARQDPVSSVVWGVLLFAPLLGIFALAGRLDRRAPAVASLEGGPRTS